jgi:uncharacterized membrane protein
VAQAYINNVYKLHRLPDNIISDRDKIFTSVVWKDLFKITDTQLIMSSSYHPQTDGQTERLNQCLEVFIPVPSSGLSGYPLLNSGIILLIIQL